MPDRGDPRLGIGGVGPPNSRTLLHNLNRGY